MTNGAFNFHILYELLQFSCIGSVNIISSNAFDVYKTRIMQERSEIIRSSMNAMKQNEVKFDRKFQTLYPLRKLILLSFGNSCFSFINRIDRYQHSTPGPTTPRLIYLPITNQPFYP